MDVIADGGSVVGFVVCSLEVVRIILFLLILFFRLGHLSIWKWGNMRGRHTVSKDEKFIPLASCDLRKQWEQVVWDTLRVLTHNTTRVGTSGVEVSQQSSVPFRTLLSLASLVGIVALSVDHVGNGGLHGELCVSVRVGGA